MALGLVCFALGLLNAMEALTTPTIVVDVAPTVVGHPGADTRSDVEE